jgi:hypothetical protein
MKPEGLAHPLPGAKPPESVSTEPKGLEGRHTNPNGTLQSWFALALELRVFEFRISNFEFRVRVRVEVEVEVEVRDRCWSGRGEGAGAIWFRIPSTCVLGNNKTSKTQANFNNKPNIRNIIGRCKLGF